MKCDVCKSKKSSIFLKKIVDGNTQNINLCQECADNLGVNDSSNITLFDQIFGEKKEKPQELFCDNCGFTHRDLKRTARLGCNLCYTKFQTHISKILKVMHKSSTHRGKTPKNFKQEENNTHVIENLNEKLKSAINEERFEEAAQLRDEIHKLT